MLTVKGMRERGEPKSLFQSHPLLVNGESPLEEQSVKIIMLKRAPNA